MCPSPSLPLCLSHQELAEINFNPVLPNMLLTASFDGTARLWNVNALHKGAMICRPTPGGPRDLPPTTTTRGSGGGDAGEAGPSAPGDAVAASSG